VATFIINSKNPVIPSCSPEGLRAGPRNTGLVGVVPLISAEALIFELHFAAPQVSCGLTLYILSSFLFHSFIVTTPRLRFSIPL
jgi:hypothetical protein